MRKPKIVDGGLAVDNRGQISFFNEFEAFPQFNIKRFYMVENHAQNFIRGWHGHKKESKIVFVVQGAIELKMMAMADYARWDKDHALTKTSLIESIQSFTLSAAKPQLLMVPAGYYHGFRNLTQDTKVIFFSNKTLEESQEDDFRAPFYEPESNVWHIHQR